MSIRFTNLRDYLTTRARECGYSTAALSEALGYGRSYISGVIQGQFNPSQKRCWEIAEFFNDDPNVILSLAGYYKPPPETELTTALANIADGLPGRLKRILLEYATFLKARQSSLIIRESHAPYLGTLYIELPSGDNLELELPPDVAAKIAELSLDEIGSIIIAALRESDDATTNNFATSGKGILHADGNTAGSVLHADDTRYVSHE